MFLTDRSGVVYKGRKEGMNPWKEKYANDTAHRTLGEVIEGADIFLGLSGPGVLKPQMVKKMAKQPLILAMANPVPEIMPDEALAVRPDALLATGRSDFPNQVNNVLCFPFIFRGALDCGATRINEEMKRACVVALAELATREPSPKLAAAYKGEHLKFGPKYLIPKPFDPRLIEEIPLAVAQAAMDSGVAARPIKDMAAYSERLKQYNSSSRLLMQPVIEQAQTAPRRIVFAEGEDADVLHAVQLAVDEAVARPHLIGRPAVIAERIAASGLRLAPGDDFEVLDPHHNPDYQRHWRHYHSLGCRRGVSVAAARDAVNNNSTALAAVMLSLGDADGIICGKVGRYDDHLRVLGDALAVRQSGRDRQTLTSVCALLLPSGPLFISDPFVNVNPGLDDIVASAEACIAFTGKFGIEPRMALLSHSNYGTHRNDSSQKMRAAAEALRARHPELDIDGEMNAETAFSTAMRGQSNSHATLGGRANVLVMPNMDTANVALGLLRSLTPTRMVGPYLHGLAAAAHILVPSVSAQGIFNMTALTVADIQAA